jgi:hypothetical protein
MAQWADSLRAKWTSGATLEAEDLDSFVDIVESMESEASNLLSQLVSAQSNAVDPVARENASTALSEAHSAGSYAHNTRTSLNTEIDSREYMDDMFGQAFNALGSSLSSTVSNASVVHGSLHDEFSNYYTKSEADSSFVAKEV